MSKNNFGLIQLAIFSALFVFSPVFAIAPPEQDFDDIDRMLDQQFKQKTADIDNLYHAYEKAIDDAFKGITKKIKVEWPDNVKLPTKSTWVGYNKDLKTRSIVNFDEGKLIIETKVANNNLKGAKQEINAMAEKLSSASTESIEELDVLSQTLKENLSKKGIDLKEQRLPKTNVLKQVLPKPEVLNIINANINKIEPVALASAVLSTSDTLIATTLTKLNKKESNDDLLSIKVQEDDKDIILEKKPPSKDGDSQSIDNALSKNKSELLEPQVTLELIEKDNNSILKMTVKFVNNYQKVLLANNFEDVKRFSKKYDVAISVILAIIETESSYNPRAISRVPAFGLMQLVPKTAGVDAHNFVHGEKKVVSPDFLFDETNNLQLGTAYFKLLKSRYLRKIKNPQSRFYCAVSSYNTGVGNLARTFTGQKNLSKAAKRINMMTSQEVYQFLLKNLPAEETRNYLKKIVTRRAKYIHFDNEIREI